MPLRNRRNLLVVGLLAVTLAAVLIGRPHCPASRPGGAEDPGVILQGHRSPVRALAFAADGTTLTSAAYNFQATQSGVEVATWNVGTGSPLAQRTAHPGPLIYLAFVPGG
jgi:hypothetical protein